MSFEELKSREKGEKETKWRTIEQEAENVKDKLGKGIDEKIKSTVVALRANGFSTMGSCEGHSGWGYPWPWVDVESPLAEKLLNDRRFNELKVKAKVLNKGTETMTEAERKEYTRLVEAKKEENEKEYQRFVGLLKEFYEFSSEETSGDVIHLDIEKGPWNQSRIQPSDVPKKVKPQEIQKTWSDTEKKRRLEVYRHEVRRFTEFLKQKFFEHNKT